MDAKLILPLADKIQKFNPFVWVWILMETDLDNPIYPEPSEIIVQPSSQSCSQKREGSIP